MKCVMPYVDVLIGNEEDFEKMLGITAEVGKGYSKKIPRAINAWPKKP